ncbi:heme ABC exporter ATP-binding protein CcmA [Streptomyces sp. UNOB3_S3]|uniref:heme ABC exporter ATP-binding protein CcmA n=1 Tax=Streptomyces sp. UNOB3_S3 TaxID=2871682 RepID=UPI001E64708F|nr:heme ABC exporter ATP-binding protein CcmA [Streptomyces sp. UNOB3_S3]MCC3776351.1 heme ABC exporter ATP-binding protein CcmA [Streptomyces sp. UNOB3_S3]
MTVSGMSMSYRKATTPVFSEVDFTVPAGRLVPVLGSNGAGKTTLLKILCGLITPGAGSVTVQGEDVVRRPVAARAHLGVSLYPERSFSFRLTCTQNLRYYASLRNLFGAEAKREIAGLLERVGLAEYADTQFMRLSLGQRKRLGMARALLGSPFLLLLDEPTANLDTQNVARFHEIIAEHAEGGGSVLFSTHTEGDLEKATDRFLRIEDSRVLSLPKPEPEAEPVSESESVSESVSESGNVAEPKTLQEAQ